MRKNNLHRLLRENMQRFKTKNLTESDNLQTASPNSNANWRQTFQDIPNDLDPVMLLTWWSDVYADMGSSVIGMSKQVEMGGALQDVRTELVSIADHTNKCRDKIRMIAPGVYAQVKDDVMILDMIKDDLVEEIKKLTTGAKFEEAATIAMQLEKIANTYARLSQYILEQSWDADGTGGDRYDTGAEAAAQAMTSGIQNLTSKSPAGKTPWPKADSTRVSALTPEQFYMLIRNKFSEGYSLKNIFDWWMTVYPDASAYICVTRILAPLQSFLSTGWGQNDPKLITNKQADQFYDYIKQIDRDRWNR